MKKIFHIGILKNNLGGVSAYINLIKNLKINKIKNIILCKNSKKKYTINFDFSYNLFTFLFKLIELYKIIKNSNIKNIHAHTQKAGLLAAFLKLFIFDISIIYTPHGLRHSQLKFIKKIFHFLVELFIFSRVNNIIIISKFEKKIIERNIFLKKFKYIYIPTAIKLPKKIQKQRHNLKKNYKINIKSKIIISIANLEIIKQPYLFFNIAEEVLKKNPNLSFIYIGKFIDPQFKKLKNQNKKIIFTGFIKNEILLSYLSQADFYLNTSLFETKSFSILESLSLGVPVICNNFSGSNELIKNNKTGYIYNYNDVNAAVSIINKYLINKKNFKKLQVIKNFKKVSNFKNFYNKYKAIYLNL